LVQTVYLLISLVVQVYSTSGERLQSMEVSEGTSHVKIDMSKYPAGMYIIKVRYANSNKSTDIRTFKMNR